MGFYKNMLNQHAYAKLAKIPDIPDCKLMVGSAEYLRPLPVVLYKHAVPPEAVPLIDNYKNLSHEDIVTGLATGALTVNDFPSNSIYMGNPVEVY